MKSHNLYNQLNKKSGFTLVELAIVIVVIGLLVGGVLQGQELIKQANIRSQIAQFEDINRATFTFRAKYNALPGDMNNATSFWGDLIDIDNPTIGTTATCNGNGDGIIYATPAEYSCNANNNYTVFFLAASGKC